MLCTRGISTANNKMTPLHKLVGFTIFGLIIQRGLSINVSNGEGLTRDQVASESHRQPQFQPISNRNSRYEIYEIHNHYVPPSSHSHGDHQNYARTPFQQEIHVQHVNAPPRPAQHAHHQEDVNVSYLSFSAAEGPNGQQITITEPVPRINQQQVGAKYLPPIRQNNENVPDYRSQHQQYFGNSAAQHVATANHGAAQHAYKGPDYLPPVPIQGVQQVHYPSPIQTPAVQTQAPAAHSITHYDGDKGYNGCGTNNCQSYPQQAVAQVATYNAGAVRQHYNLQQNQLIPVSAHFQVSDYVAPHAAVSAPAYYSTPGYLPPHHNSEVRDASVQTLQPHYVQHYAPQQQQHQQQQQQVVAPTIFTALPRGYEFNKPENSAQAIAELHSQQIQQQQQQQAALAHQQQQRAVLSSYVQKQNLANHIIRYQQQNQHVPQLLQPALNRAPVYLPPVQVEATAAAVAPQQSHNQEPQMHSLNSYMKAVQPYERYGYSSFSNAAALRQPFAQYGAPVAQAPVNLQVAPMYSEPATRPIAYASAMSYKTNPVPQDYTTFTYSKSHQSLQQPPLHINEQTLQRLQSLMPKDIQEQQVVAGRTGNVRTVQILNSHLIKTLKVLETHDGAGVKTIKILGDTDENPMGTHQTVRIVRPSKINAHHENVQTVKIFNDHKAVQLADGSTVAEAATVSNNEYLPPAKEAEKKRSVRDSHETHALPQTFRRQR